MAAEIPTREPITIIAGDTAKWTRAVDDYSYADGWRLTYELRGASKLDVTATADTDGVGHSITVDAGSTGALEPGQYEWFARVAYNGEVYTVDRGVLTVEPNPSKAEAGDLVLSEETELKLVEQQIRALAATPLESYAVGQRSATYQKLQDLMVARGILIARLGRKRGQRVPSIAVRFVAPR